jgi:hypothetical protein
VRSVGGRLCVCKALVVGVHDGGQASALLNSVGTFILDDETTVDKSSSTGTVDVPTFCRTARLPKQVLRELGVYSRWRTTLARHESALAALPMAVSEVYSLHVRQHDEWVERGARHGCDSARHAAFAEWVCACLQLPPGAVVWDVGGGQGHSALELVARGMRVVLIDPTQHAGKALSAGFGEVSTVPAPELHAAPITIVRDSFDRTFPERHPELCLPDALVGLHPDEATDAIAEMGLRLRLPFAVVPCCVFHSLFPHRRRRTGQHVTSYNGLVLYLSELDEGIVKGTLPLEGANIGLYFSSTGMGAASPARMCISVNG